MAYCNWCQLESETDDFCIWCKRPLGTAKGVYQQTRSDLHFLRSSDEGQHEPTPIFAIIGALVVLGLVAGGLIAFHARQEQATAEPDHWVLKDQAPEQPAQPAAPAPVVFAPSPGSLYIPPRPEPKSPQKDSSSSSHVIRGSDYDLAKRNNSLEGARGENTLYFEGADFKSVADKKGAKHLIGDVIVVNDTYGNLQSGSLWLRAGNSQFDLLRYDGSINDPKILKKFTVSGKASLKCHVLVKGMNPNVDYIGKRVLGMEGLLEGQPVHVEDELIVRYK